MCQHPLVLCVQSKLRLDAFLAARLPSASRARLQASIKEGLVAVNGRLQVGQAHMHVHVALGLHGAGRRPSPVCTAAPQNPMHGTSSS